MAKTLYDYWFVQFDFPNAKGKPYKSSGGKMVWNEALKREIPLGWEVGSLLDIADYMNGLACQKFRPTGNEFLRVIKIKEMHEGFSENTELVSQIFLKKQSLKMEMFCFHGLHHWKCKFGLAEKALLIDTVARLPTGRC